MPQKTDRPLTVDVVQEGIVVDEGRSPAPAMTNRAATETAQRIKLAVEHVNKKAA